MKTSEQRYQDALVHLLEDEGGWYDGSGSHDPNPTYQGVTQNTYAGWRARRGLPQRTVREMTTDERSEIYLTYWKAAKCDLLPELTAQVVFDHAVNSGPSRALKALQRAAGAVPDGVWGPSTALLVRQVPDAKLATLVAWERLEDYCDIVASNPKKLPALKTWVRRTLRYGKRSAAACGNINT